VRVELTGQEEALAGSLAGDHRLGRGESEVLALGRRLGRAIVDEGRASRVAAALGIRRVSTLFLPVLGAQGRAMTRADAIAFLRRLALATGARAEAVYAIEEFLRRDP
jgi:predicted nucleic acid-binding protein